MAKIPELTEEEIKELQKEVDRVKDMPLPPEAQKRHDEFCEMIEDAVRIDSEDMNLVLREPKDIIRIQREYAMSEIAAVETLRAVRLIKHRKLIEDSIKRAKEEGLYETAEHLTSLIDLWEV